MTQDPLAPRDARTIEDFGTQWTRYQEFDGYLGSRDLLADTIAPFLTPDAIRGCAVADIGSGQGRVVRSLLDAGAAHVIAVEPSAAFDVLKRNTADAADRIAYLHAPGHLIPPSGDRDFVFAFGVLHHIVDPVPVLRAARAALKPGGRFVGWVYGAENNSVYLALAAPARAVTQRLPPAALAALTWAIDPFLFGYMHACRVAPLPMRRYMLSVLMKLPARHRRRTIYDQLNPAHAKYYRREEVLAMMQAAGYVDVQLHWRHQYSWSFTGQRARNEGGA